MALTIDCGEGSHEVCRGAGSEHYLIPQADDGTEFECACPCHAGRCPGCDGTGLRRNGQTCARCGGKGTYR